MESAMLRTEAAQLVDDLNQAWSKNPEFNLRELKKFPSAAAILSASPEMRAAVARRILEVVAAFANRALKNGNDRWFSEQTFPWGAVYLESSLLKQRIPFSEADLVEMLERLVGIGFLSASQFEFVGALVGTLEKHAETQQLSPRLRDACSKFGDMLVGRQTTAARRRLWNPDAADRKAAARLERLLAGPLALNRS